jgi:hypothetical protein
VTTTSLATARPAPRNETFCTGPDLSVWTPSYLPAWSSRAAAAATWAAGPDGLTLSLPPDQPLWCPDTHETPLRVSGIQSANWSGPVGSTAAPQPFRPGLRVQERQPVRFGLVPHFGRVEVECRAAVASGSMFSAWLVGLEDAPDRSGEICLVEVFGDSARTDPGGATTVAVGTGVHPFRDPRLHEEFSADRYPLDVGDWHRYAADWHAGGVDFFVDDVLVRSVGQAPDYPMMLLLAVFDFPQQVSDPAFVPQLTVRRVRLEG